MGPLRKVPSLDALGPESAGALGVHPTLRNHFTVEVNELIDHSHVFKEYPAGRTRCHDVEVVRDRSTCRSGELTF
jgi:hypothetical protein